MNLKQWHHDILGNRTVEALRKNNFNAEYFPEREEAIKYVVDFIATGITVGIGGSATTKELKIVEKAKNKGAVIFDHNLPGLAPEEKLELRRKQLTCDLFICSSNAITLEGVLVNVDGTGNRIAALTFGPKKVIVISGINKLCQDTDVAFERLKLIAGPMNNKRIGTSNPCTDTGKCMDCQNKTRICNGYSILRKKPSGADINVVLIGENIGY